MRNTIGISRRNLFSTLMLSAALIPALNIISENTYADDSLLQVDNSAAKKLNYIDDVRKSTAIPAGRSCNNCALYEGAEGSIQGACSVFPGKQVKATGWCSAWAPQM